ncbi:putative Transcription factor [Quillaja saponaria]|uniref:Transcription factor n=1 Tax=Quillaja saponaria TaxID=32244 RepID=A0AAD7PRQ6_QUISA|nr:putative Transcription factor [Quillaja saponaria]
MGEDCGTWIPQLPFDWQSPNLHSFGAALDAGKKKTFSEYMNPGIDMVMRNGTMPVYVSPELPPLQLGKSNESHGWFYCLPRFRQAPCMPAPNFTIEGKFPAGPEKNLRENTAHPVESHCPQKQFFVVDQSGDQTTFIFDSWFGSPIQCLTSWNPKLNGVCNSKVSDHEPLNRRHLNNFQGPSLIDEYVENQGTDVQSEMHEDTEEIDALLESDDCYSTEDDEVTSTGHSPSTMTAHNKEEFFGGSTEEVASCAGKTKKRKLFDGAFNDVQLMDTASSLNLKRSCEYEDDAESKCASGYNQGSEETGSSSRNKKIRKEKIKDVLNILQSIIPGGKGKDPIVIIDEAIQCLKSLKLKAKALGLDSL